jgi:hypothetical protein
MNRAPSNSSKQKESHQGSGQTKDTSRGSSTGAINLKKKSDRS